MTMTNRKRKHRIVIEVTLDRPGTERDCVRVLNLLHLPPPSYIYSPEVIKISRPKEFSRVFRAELSNRIRNTPEFCGETG